MRIALVSDIHGNLIALDAVLADAHALGVEQFWFIGDFSAIGPEPATVLDRVTGLSNARFTRGNTDRYVVTGDRPPPDLDTVRSNPALITTYAGIAASLAWTRGFLTASGWLDWLARLPLDIRLTTPEGIRILAVHAAPGSDDGEGIHPGRSNAELAQLIADSDADVIFVGHTHQAMIRRVGRVPVVNLGSVSNPRSDDLRASYVLLDITASGVEFVHRRVPYDHGAFSESVYRSRHPAVEFILSYQRGEQSGREPHADDTPFRLGEPVRVAAAAISVDEDVSRVTER
ncbi:MAG TPA: metallophosphoesterase family protein [Longimicrobiales bacterium]|nr:metallophosphoesterase family protein [Longimicrobiales bacterium]